jgi:NADPH:quinone reductase-like Zn-dependent oxidoreductase
MKASVYKEYGSQDVLKIKEIEKPVPKENEILVKVGAATVNRTDCAMLTAKPFIMRFGTGLFRPKNKVLGTDFAGTIEEVGNKVQLFKPGQRIFGFYDAGVSSHAEYLTIKESEAIGIVPESVSYEQATASIEGAHYAYNFINKVKLSPGQKVMVYGASGAIGSAMVQLLKYFDAHVTAVCDTKSLEAVKSLQPDKTIDYTREDFQALKGSYDYVFDAVGKCSFAICKPLLKQKGIYISSELGKHSQNIFLSLFTPLLSRKKVRFPFPSDSKRSVRLIQKLLQEKKFLPLIDRTYNLELTAEAFKYVLSGQKIGNIVIKMD